MADAEFLKKLAKALRKGAASMLITADHLDQGDETAALASFDTVLDSATEIMKIADEGERMVPHVRA